MNRLKKELKKRGIIFKSDEMQVMSGAEYDTQVSLLFFTKDFIVCRFDCAVLDSEFHIFDRNFNLIATQQIYKTNVSFSGIKSNPWFCITNFEQEENTMNENEMKQETTATETKQEENTMIETMTQEQEEKAMTAKEMIEELEEMTKQLEEKREEIEESAIDYLESDDDVFCETCEILDTYNGFLNDTRCYPMDEINDLYYGVKPLEMLEKVDRNDFSTSDDYFYEDWQGLHSVDDIVEVYRDSFCGAEVWEEVLNVGESYDSELEEYKEKYETIGNMINCLEENKKKLQEVIENWQDLKADFESTLELV